MIANNQILLGEILRNFAALEIDFEELKAEFHPAKLMMKTPDELHEFSTRMTATKNTINWFRKKLQ